MRCSHYFETEKQFNGIDFYFFIYYNRTLHTLQILINNNYYTLRWVHRGVAGCRRDVLVTECNAPFASWMEAVLAVAKKQGLAFVVVEREDGSRSGETAPGRSRGRRK